MRRFGLVLALAFISVASLLSQSAELTVTSAGPTGELQELTQASEIRLTFSEPMIPLGRIPDNPALPWVRITPAIKGTFRWSGTSMLIFTPDPAAPLPYATRYRVVIDTAAEAVSGRRLRAPFEFSFTTPTVRLTSMRSARLTGRFDSPVTLALQFNQPVRPQDVLAHAVVRYRPTGVNLPVLTPAERARMAALDPDGPRRFDAKIADAKRNASRTDVVAVRVAPEGERPKFAAAPTYVVLQTAVAPPPGTALEFVLDGKLPSPQGPEVPGITQRSATTLPEAFFVIGPLCRTECDPSGYQSIRFTAPVGLQPFSSALAVVDVTTPAAQPVARTGAPARPGPRESSTGYSLEDVGFERQPPARTWAVQLNAALQSEDGQTLGYPSVSIIENWNESAFTSFGDGHGLWETANGPQLPFYSRNYESVTEHLARVPVSELMRTIVSLELNHFQRLPDGAGTLRTLPVTPNRTTSHGFGLERAMTGTPFGLFWAGIEPGRSIPRSEAVPRNTSTLVQVTNLGVTVKDSPQSTLVFVTRLDNGEPVARARVSIVNTSSRTVWRGTTGADGVVVAPALKLRQPNRPWQLEFIVLAEKDGDTAYTGSNWHQGIQSWSFNVDYNLWEATDILRASIFTDRGVYKPGEPVQVKAIVRSDTPKGMRLFPSGTALDIVVRDARDQEVDRRTVKVNRWSSAEWSWTVPADATLGQYRIEATIPGSQPKEGNDLDDREPGGEWLKRATGGFLVAAYRRPDFEVTTSLSATEPFAGESMSAVVNARYLFGGTMAKRPVTWSLSRTTEYNALPESVYERFPRDEYTFGYYPNFYERNPVRIAGETTALDASGRLTLNLPSDRDTDQPYRYTFEADVEDISRQHIAGRSAVVVHPASIYLGVGRKAEFIEAGKPAQLSIVAVDLKGQTVPGVRVTATLYRQQWNSVQRAEGGGFYTWASERLEERVAEYSVTTGAEPVPLAIAAPEGGSFLIRVTAQDSTGRRARTDRGLYVIGDGYTAWARFDHPRIELEPERSRYKPGDTARILIKSPWERATALLTVEREGIRQHRRFALTSTQQVVEVPITAADIPNVYVSVLLVRGRTSTEIDAQGNDPGRPAFRLGYVELPVDDATKILSVKVSADRTEYRPANSARVSVAVNDSAGRPARSEVTLWAVDTGVLALTGYNAPDVARAIHQHKALQVMTTDNRQQLVSRRVLTPKGGTEGGGGGAEGLRTDFRPLAFWLGSVETDGNGRATRSVTLPDTLTTYRIMAVAGDSSSRFGSAASTITVTKPITLVPALPRFLALTDRASFGALVSNTLATGTKAVVTVRSMTPELLEFTGTPTAEFELGPGATTVARFDAIARAVGAARVRVSVTAGPNTDAFEMTLPVGAPARMETTAAFGDTTDRAVERLLIPAGIAPRAGGLTVELASTALVGLGEGARYLADYPYLCAEQRASAALALSYAADLGNAFSMGRIAPAEYRARAQQILDELPKYQCADGGFGYWPGRCSFGNFYLTSYILDVFKLTATLGMKSDARARDRALDFLDAKLKRPAPQQVQDLPFWTASAGYAVKVLTDWGRNQDGNITRLLGAIDRAPIFALSYLADAMSGGGGRAGAQDRAGGGAGGAGAAGAGGAGAAGAGGAGAAGAGGAGPGRAASEMDRASAAVTSGPDRVAGAGRAQSQHPQYADVVRRIMNAVRVEGDRAHVQELEDEALFWLWNSNPRSTAIVLEGLVRRGDDPRFVPHLVRGLLQARKNGRWSNTQENAWALAALVAYYKKYEAEVPNMTATVTLSPVSGAGGGGAGAGADRAGAGGAGAGTSAGGAVGAVRTGAAGAGAGIAAGAGPQDRTIGSARFRGRSSTAQIVRLEMPELLKQVAAATGAQPAAGPGMSSGAQADLTISRTGTGRLYYTARLQYVPGTALPVSDQGIRIERRYERVTDSGPGAVSGPGRSAGPGGSAGAGPASGPRRSAGPGGSGAGQATSGPGAQSGPSSAQARSGPAFAAGDLVRVTLTITLPKERRYVAVTDPLAAGFEAVDSWFQTTASDLAREASSQSSDDSWMAWWRRGGFDFIDKYDDRVSIFATRLSEGRHEFSYLVRATTAGVFTAAGTWAEEMYAPEVNGRSAPVVITIK